MASKKKPALRLRVGRTYVDRNGNKLRITGRINGKKSNFIGEDGCVYFPDGSFAPKGQACQFDLIREVSAPKPATARKAAKAEIWYSPVTDDGELELWNAAQLKSMARGSMPGMKIVRVEVRR